MPWLATDWQVSDDGLAYTFDLRDDVTFSDGTAFTAESVQLAFDSGAATLAELRPPTARCTWPATTPPRWWTTTP